MINLKGVNTKGEFEALPEGRYNVVVDKAELVTTKENGHPMIKATYKVIDGDFKNRLVWDNFVLVENSLWKVKTFLEAAGSNLTEKENISEPELANSMVGMAVSIYVEHRSAPDGKVVANAKNYTAVSAGNAAKPTIAKKSSGGLLS